MKYDSYFGYTTSYRMMPLSTTIVIHMPLLLLRRSKKPPRRTCITINDPVTLPGSQMNSDCLNHLDPAKPVRESAHRSGPTIKGY